MDPSKSLRDQLRRWLQAELIDADVAEAIQRWEDSQLNQSMHSSVRHLTVPIRLSILLGSLLLAAGGAFLAATRYTVPGTRLLLHSYFGLNRCYSNTVRYSVSVRTYSIRYYE